jgi:formate hydrogenlyase subunit 6/NADH:ubiquinone oxidoreductase subunit I
VAPARSSLATTPSTSAWFIPYGVPRLDVGACLFAPDEAQACPHGAVRFTQEFAMGVTTRNDLVTETGAVRLGKQLDGTHRRLFGRSLRFRSVAAGSCNGCEAERHSAP